MIERTTDPGARSEWGFPLPSSGSSDQPAVGRSAAGFQLAVGTYSTVRGDPSSVSLEFRGWDNKRGGAPGARGGLTLRCGSVRPLRRAAVAKDCKMALGPLTYY